MKYLRPIFISEASATMDAVKSDKVSQVTSWARGKENVTVKMEPIEGSRDLFKVSVSFTHENENDQEAAKKEFERRFGMS
jgi:hypothetical protein